jgi:hypothetical protein
MAGRLLIADRIGDWPEMLAAFIGNAPALVPNTAMPLSEREALDIAAHRYEIGR